VSALHIRVPYDRLKEHISFIRQERLNLEIFFSAESLDSLKPADISRLKADLDYNPSLTLHAPHMDLSPGAVDAKIRGVTLERFSHVLDIAKHLRPRNVVFHSGYEKWKYAHNVHTWLESSLKTWRELSEKAHEAETKIAIENIFEDEPDNLRLLMEELNSETFGICFDTGHCNLFTTKPLSAWLESLSPYIIELHLHDNDGSFDSHLPVEDGTFNFSELFESLKGKNIVYTVEARTPQDVMKSMERLRKYL
jgi:sugar phosphate isomerase/epimerase